MDFASVPLVVGLVIDRADRAQVERLVLSLEAARKSGGPRFQLVTLLDAEAAKALEGFALGKVFQVESKLGTAAGHNKLLAEAFSYQSTRWYLRLELGALVHPDLPTELIAQQGRMSRPGLVEATQFPEEHPKTYEPDTGATPWCHGCAMLITRDLYETIGGFDEHLGSSCDDVDLSWRARVAGFSLATASKALVSFSPPMHEQARAELLRSGAALAAKWGGEAFRRQCADDYQRLMGEALPAPRVGAPSSEMRAVAEFNAGFQFAPTRW